MAPLNPAERERESRFETVFSPSFHSCLPHFLSTEGNRNPSLDRLGYSHCVPDGTRTEARFWSALLGASILATTNHAEMQCEARNGGDGILLASWF